MHREVLHQQTLKQWGVAKVFSRTNQDRVTKFTFVLAVVLNTLFIKYYRNLPCKENGGDPRDDDVGLYDCVYMAMPQDQDGTNINTVVQAVSIVLIVSAAYTVILCLVVRLPVKFQSFIDKDFSALKAAAYTSWDAKTLYHTCYLLLAILSIQPVYHHLASFLLLDMISMSPVTQDTMNAIWKPRKMLFMTLFLTIIVVYVYAVFAFFLYNNEENISDLPNTHTLMNAVKEFLRYGSPSGSLNNDMVQTVHTARWISEVSFYMATFTLWNVIKGITIDTFVELRRDLVMRLEDTEEKCYICGIEKLVFNRALDREAFDLHISTDQNLWNYVYYCIFIWEQDKDDDDGLEYYVRHCVDDDDLSWFPMNKAIRLTEHLEKGASDSLPFLFRKDLTKLNGAVDVRMNMLKDTLTRSINRVEQALIFVPDVQATKKKKKVQDAVESAPGSASGAPGSAVTGSQGQQNFRPMTGTAGADFASAAHGGNGHIKEAKALSPAEELRKILSRRENGIEESKSLAYMDAMQLRLSVDKLEGISLTEEMIGNLFVRVVSDTGVYTATSGFNDTTTVGEAKQDTPIPSDIPISFNSNEYFVVFGGNFPSGHSARSDLRIKLQIMYSRKVDTFDDSNRNTPKEVSTLLGSVQVPISTLIESAEGTGTHKVRIKQILQIDVGKPDLPECTMVLHTAASEELIADFNANTE